ncbi:carcinoembryonic antigen-related cell adhesion molecule 6-like [Ambystoma mexicanum]|uniref:carcinoembryonic antigen-related cell adhesion molecule 6-like n=1 Tax=Ambystoma mexicanum TaxID=8296 RepID=UPI0037E743D1
MVSLLSNQRSPRSNGRLQGLMITVVFLVCIQRTSGQGSSPEVTARVGETVTLPAPATTNIITFSWYRGTAGITAQRIFTYLTSTSTQNNGPQFTGREAGLADGSLQIRGVRTSDTGNYTVLMTLGDASTSQGTTQLRVYEDVTKPIVNYVSAQLVENRGPANITCETSNAETILWLFNNSPVLPSNIILSADNRTLIIKNVTRGDTGTYQCEGINPLSRSKSDPKMLTVAYGPENIMIDPAGSQLLPVGAKFSLTCTALSVPGAAYQWLLNDNDLKQYGSTFTIAKVSSMDKGNYTCEAQNPFSQLSVKATVSINVNGTEPSPVTPATTCSCWQVTLGVALGVILGAAVIIAGVIVYNKRLLDKKRVQNDQITWEKPNIIQKSETHYENTRQTNIGQPANEKPGADSTYTELKYGDQATYEQLNRP